MRRLNRASVTVAERLLWRAALWAPFGGQYVSNEKNGGYLLRTYLLPSRKQKTWMPGLYLHYFIRSDSDRDPHNHPWRWARSVILLGGYEEKRAEMDDWNEYFIVSRDVRPGNFNWFCRDDFHRVDLLEKNKGCWSLFLAGRRLQPSDGTDWGFLNMETGEVMPWGKHLEKNT
jgi:hypothetical protein